MKKINFTIAVLICLNTIVGGGIFINLKPLTQQMGAWGFVSYLAAASLMAPLVASMASMARLHPVTGGLYVYSREYLGSCLGFVSGWGYFIGKTTSFALLMHKVVSFFYTQIPCIQAIPLPCFDYAAIAFFVMMNSVGVSIGGRIQYVVSVLKAIPILFALCCGLYLGNFDAFLHDPHGFAWASFFVSIPVALYALTGFEVICGIGSLLEDSKKNIARVIMTAFAIATCLVISFQIAMYVVLGNQLSVLADPFSALMEQGLPGLSLFKHVVGSIVFIAITGGAFSIMASNAWNIQALAQDDHLPFSCLFRLVNAQQAPWACLLLEGVLACMIITVTSDQIPLQNMATLAMFVTYLMTCIAAVRASSQGLLGRFKPIALCAAFTCCLVVGICLKNVITFGLSVPFVVLFCGGCLVAIARGACRGKEPI